MAFLQHFPEIFFLLIMENYTTCRGVHMREPVVEVESGGGLSSLPSHHIPIPDLSSHISIFVWLKIWQIFIVYQTIFLVQRLNDDPRIGLIL